MNALILKIISRNKIQTASDYLSPVSKNIIQCKADFFNDTHIPVFKFDEKTPKNVFYYRKEVFSLLHILNVYVNHYVIFR